MFSCLELGMLCKCNAIFQCICMIRRSNSFCLEFPGIVSKNMDINNIGLHIKNSYKQLGNRVDNGKV